MSGTEMAVVLAHASAKATRLGWQAEDDIIALMPTVEELATYASDEIEQYFVLAFQGHDFPYLGPVIDVLRARRRSEAEEPGNPRRIDLETDWYFRIHDLNNDRKRHAQTVSRLGHEIIGILQSADASVIQEVVDILPPCAARVVVRQTLERKLSFASVDGNSPRI